MHSHPMRFVPSSFQRTHKNAPCILIHVDSLYQNTWYDIMVCHSMTCISMELQAFGMALHIFCQRIINLQILFKTLALLLQPKIIQSYSQTSSSWDHVSKSLLAISALIAEIVLHRYTHTRTHTHTQAHSFVMCYERDHLSRVNVFCDSSAKQDMETNLHQSTSLAGLQKTLEVHGCKLWVTILSIVPHYLQLLPTV